MERCGSLRAFFVPGSLIQQDSVALSKLLDLDLATQIGQRLAPQFHAISIGFTNHLATPGGNLVGSKNSAPELFGPVGRHCRVGGPRHRILIDPGRGKEAAGHEFHRFAGRRHKDATDREIQDRAYIRFQPADDGFVLNNSHVVIAPLPEFQKPAIQGSADPILFRLSRIQFIRG